MIIFFDARYAGEFIFKLAFFFVREPGRIIIFGQVFHFLVWFTFLNDTITLHDIARFIRFWMELSECFVK